mgnify:CR=1 FL=1
MVLSDCTSSVTPAVQQANLADMQRVGGRIMTAADLEQLRPSSGDNTRAYVLLLDKNYRSIGYTILTA